MSCQERGREEVGGGEGRGEEGRGGGGEGLINLLNVRTHLTFILVDIFL